MPAASVDLVKARANGECGGCGYPSVTEGVTKVAYQGSTVIRCELCDPLLAEEPDEADPNAYHTVRARIIVQKYAKPDGSFFIYVVELDGEGEQSGLPEQTRRTFGLRGPVGSHERGDIVLVTGRFVSDARYGFQMEASSAAQLAIKESQAGLIAFLSRFPNIGRFRAESLLRDLGGMEGVLDALDNDPQKLCVCSGITPERAAEVKEAYDKQSGFREFRLFASQLGLGEALIAAAIDAWGDEAQRVIEEDPFELMDLPRCGFKTADAVHKRLNRDPKQPSRCAAGVLVALNLAADEGNTYSLPEELAGNARGRAGDEIRRLGMSPEEIETGLALLETEHQKMRRGQAVIVPRKVVRETGRVYLKDIYDAELAIAREFSRLQSANIRPIPMPVGVWGTFEPAPEQEDALKHALQSTCLIITGGPGTGKSTLLNIILNALEASGHDMALCAPTGKAAKRMTELTKRPASTIHRLTAMAETSSSQYEIPASVMVVDEASMVDTELFARLLRCIRTGARLIIVGDVDQLPSIAPGRVLFDLIESGLIPVVRLTRIFRQKSDGLAKRIPEVARAINLGECPDLGVKGTDVTFLPFDDTELLQQKVVKAVLEQLPAKLGCQPEDIQVISPQKGEEGKKNWPIGVKALNFALQDALNPKVDPKELHIGEGYLARTDDQIIHRKNNYDLGVMNGELGRVIRLDTKPFFPAAEVVTSFRTKRARNIALADITGKETRTKAERAETVMVVDFGDGRKVGYTRDEIRETQLAYALTCHMCQGSQYKVVVLVVHNVHHFMLTQPLLYTALTRAEEYVLIIGQADRFAKAVRNRRGVERRTSLQERLLNPPPSQSTRADAWTLLCGTACA